MLELLDPDRLRQQRDETEDVLRLRPRPRHDLMRHVGDGARLRVDAVAELRLTDDEAALPGHEHVVEDDDRVDLLETRAERVIEVAAAEVEALAAEEAQTRGVARDRERVRVGRVVRRALEHGRGHDEDLVRERPDRREQPRPADHDPVVVLLDDARGDRLLLLLRRPDRAVRLREDQRVRQQQVVLAHVLVVAAYVLGVVALVLTEPLGRGGHRHDRRVAVVACATQVAERVLGPDVHRLTTPGHVLDTRGLQERHADALAARRRLVGHHVAQHRIVLEVEQLGVGAHDVRELRDLGDPAGEPLPLDLDLDRTLVERSDVLASRSRRHRGRRL